MKKRLCSILLCAALFLTIGGPVAKAVAVSAPSMTVEVNQVEKGTTVEVSLIVRGGALSQSAHAVLSYDPAKLTLKSWVDGGPITPTATPMAGSTMAPGNVAGKPSLVYQPDGSTRALLYLGASDAQNGMGADKALVTVQFAYAGDGKPGDITEDNLSDYVSIAAAGSFDQLAMAAYPAVLHLKDETNSRYIYGYGETLPAGYQAMTVDFALESKPSLYNNTGAVVSGDHAIVFFDWDGSVLSAIAAPQDAASAVAVEEAKLAALTEKTGYAFQGWVLSDGSRTAYNPSETLPVFLDFKNVTQTSLLVQAVYQGTGELRVKADSSKSSDYVLDKANIYYTRYGAATDKDGKYSIKVSFDRAFEESGKKVGVERATTPGALVGMTPSNTSLATLYSFLGGESSERITFEIVPTRDMSSVSVYMVDVHGVAAWPNAGSRSGAAYTIKAADFIKYGTANYICEQGILFLQHNDQSEWDKYVDAQAFKDATGGTAVANVEAAKTAVKSELMRIHTSEGQYRILTYAEFVAAVTGK